LPHVTWLEGVSYFQLCVNKQTPQTDRYFFTEAKLILLEWDFKALKNEAHAHHYVYEAESFTAECEHETHDHLVIMAWASCDF
jgi:hypothetical protein